MCVCACVSEGEKEMEALSSAELPAVFVQFITPVPKGVLLCLVFASKLVLESPVFLI